MSGDQNPPDAPGKSAPVTTQNKVSLSELIAKTPGAQTREQLLERIKAREGKRPKKLRQSAPSEEQLTEREPLPIPDDPAQIHDDPDQYAVGYFKRKQAEEHAQQKPPKGFKLRLVPKKDKPDPADKK